MKSLLRLKYWSVLVLIGAGIGPAHALVSGYTFASTAGTFTSISGTTLFSGAWDDQASSLLTIPFSFSYNGTAYTTVGVNANGFITLGAVNTTTYCGLQTSAANSIAGYGTDLVAASGTSTVQYAITGSTPNRHFVVQWNDCDHYNNASANHLTFQIILNETSNTIQLVWGASTVATTMGANGCTDAATESGSVGLLGSSTADFNIRSVTNGNNTWSSSVAGQVITAVCNLSPTNIPADGQTYTWTPPAAVPMSFVSCTTSFVNNGQAAPRSSVLNAILKVQVVTTGNTSAFNLTSLALSTSGCTNAATDITNAKVFFTGGSNTFTNTTQFGSTATGPNGTYTVTGSATLVEGTNYFWVTYNIQAAAGIGNTLTGCCTQVVGSGVMGTHIPTVTCPSGAQTVTGAVGSWTQLTNAGLHGNGGVMLLLSDGTVMAKTNSGGASYGNIWDKLTPDATGSYANGTWTTLAPMTDTRLYFSSQVLKDGRVYVAGGEYGTGLQQAETYDPVANTWTAAPSPGQNVSDANSAILEDGRVLQALVAGNLKGNVIYNPSTNTYAAGPTCLGIHNESSWVKLQDNSILFVDRLSMNSERYIPATNSWISDATVPVSLYDAFGDETGAGLLLPDGRAFFIGSTGSTAYYTPSGTTSPGIWAAGPTVPGAKGAPDAPAAMMVNGKVLMAVSPVPTSADHFPPPTSFYEFDPTINTYVQINAPGGTPTLGISCFETNMLDLPDGKVLYSRQGSSTYYVYSPAGAPVAVGKPAIASVTQTGCTTYRATGTLFNGISEGAAYGDDWQMASNYPIIRLTSGANVYYARTSNWNSTGVRRGALADTTQFTLPAGLPAGTYSLVVVANGIASDPVSFTPSTTLAPGVSIALTAGTNPGNPGASVSFTATPTFGGSGPTYLWKVDGVSTGITTQTFTTTSLTNGQVVTCLLTSNLSCASPTTATSNGITMVINGVKVSPKLFLEGPFVSAAGLMQDSLRVKTLLPLSEPYTAMGYVHTDGGGGETTTSPVLAVSGSNAIVDWVLVELRDANNPSTVVASHAALVQRDGDVVGMDGTSAVQFGRPAGNYYVAVRHRDHFGAMTATVRALTSTTTAVNFTTTATVTYGTAARKDIAGTQVLWAGNVVFDHVLSYTGTNNDRDPILARIGGTVTSNTVTGYYPEDANMNGTVKYTGLANDRDPILVNIGGLVLTNTLIEQLP